MKNREDFRTPNSIFIGQIIKDIIQCRESCLERIEYFEKVAKETPGEFISELEFEKENIKEYDALLASARKVEDFYNNCTTNIQSEVSINYLKENFDPDEFITTKDGYIQTKS